MKTDYERGFDNGFEEASRQSFRSLLFFMVLMIAILTGVIVFWFAVGQNVYDCANCTVRP